MHNKDINSLGLKILLILFVLSILITSCRHRPFEKPSALIDDIVCNAPCWAGIIPGSTTFEESQEILNSSIYITGKGSSEYLVDKNRSQLRWIFPSSFSESSGTAHYLDGYVQFIEFGYDYGPKFLDVVEHFGEPDKVSAMVHYADCSYAHVSIKYDQIGLVASRYVGCISMDAKTIKLNRNDRITDVQLFIPGTYDSLVIPGKVVIVLEYDNLTETLHDWQGFGDIILYFPDEP